MSSARLDGVAPVQIYVGDPEGPLEVPGEANQRICNSVVNISIPVEVNQNTDVCPDFEAGSPLGLCSAVGLHGNELDTSR